MADLNKDSSLTDGTDDQNKNIDQSGNQSGENNQQNDSQVDQEKITNLISKYKTPEELAKAKMSSDREYSKLQAEKTALELVVKQQVYEAEKKIASKDKSYLLELSTIDIDTAKRIAKEVYNQELDEVNVEILNQQQDKLLVSKKDDDQGEEKKFVPLDKLQELVDLKLKEQLLKDKEKLQQQNVVDEVNSLIKTTLETSGIKEGTPEAKEILDTYNLFVDGKQVNKDFAKLALEASLSRFKQTNLEYNQKIEESKKKLAENILTVNDGKGGSSTLSYTQEDVDIAKKSNLTLERYLDLKKKYIKF